MHLTCQRLIQYKILKNNGLQIYKIDLTGKYDTIKLRSPFDAGRIGAQTTDTRDFLNIVSNKGGADRAATATLCVENKIPSRQQKEASLRGRSDSPSMN